MAKGKGGFIGQDGLNAPDAPTGVSGTAGDTQVTVSWTAPSDVGGSAITGYNVQASDGTRAVPSFSYASKTVSIASQDTTPEDIFFSSDGTKMYMIGNATDSIYQYTLSTAWDVSTATYDSVSLSITSQDSSPSDFYFKSDGYTLYIIGRTTDSIYQYTLSTAWDLSTASYDSKSFSVATQASNPTGLYFKSDGTKVYIVGFTSNALFQYSLSTAWDISTASYDSVTFDISGQGVNPQGLAFTPDGTTFFIPEVSTGDFVSEYGLSTAWDLSTASYTGELFDYASEDGYGSGFYYKDNETAYLLGRDSDAVFQYEAPEYPTASPVTVTGLTNGTSYTFSVWAINAFGYSAPSDASGSVTPVSPFAAATAYFMGGSGSNVTIDYVNIQTTGNAIDFGDLAQGKDFLAVSSSSTRAIITGFETSGATANDIDKLDLTTTGNSADFGELTQNSQWGGGAVSNGTRGVHKIGYGNSVTLVNSIEYVTIASDGNGTDFGDSTITVYAACGQCMNSTTRGLFAGGGTSSNVKQNVIEYITIASTGNATDFGDLTQTTIGSGGASNSTRAVIVGGDRSGASYSNVMDYVTIASTGNASDFGDLTVGRRYPAASADSTRLLIGGGDAGSDLNNITKITIATTGNDSSFGDLTVARKGLSAASNSHGGLS